MKSKIKQSEPTSLVNLHKGYAEFLKRVPDPSDRYKLRVSVPNSLWRATGIVPEALAKQLEKKWTLAERDAVVRETTLCPVCEDTQEYPEVFEADSKWEGEPLLVVHERIVTCKCKKWKHIWDEAKVVIPPMYHYVNLHTLKPNTLSRLSLEQQQSELDTIRKYRNQSFLFFGPSGTGKTTFAMALLRHAYERKSNEKHFWSSDSQGGASFREERWIWRGNFNSMLQEYNDKNKESWERPADAPDVTVKKIFAAHKARRRPVLVIEEVDKIEMNAHRVKFLFGILDAMLNNDGQIIMTTNLTQAGFLKFLQDADEAAGDTIARRLIQAGVVRDYFEFVAPD
jgi:DNA replication protein DnaC